MRLKLVENHRAVLGRAWSIRFAVAAGLLHGAGPAISAWAPIEWVWLAAITEPLAYLADAGVVIARIVAQDNLTT